MAFARGESRRMVRLDQLLHTWFFQVSCALCCSKVLKKAGALAHRFTFHPPQLDMDLFHPTRGTANAEFATNNIAAMACSVLGRCESCHQRSADEAAVPLPTLPGISRESAELTATPTKRRLAEKKKQ